VYTNQLKELVAALNDSVLTAEYKKLSNKAQMKDIKTPFKSKYEVGANGAIQTKVTEEDENISINSEAIKA
jgi:hypothetical protein